MVFGNSRPDSKQIAQSESEHIRVYLLVGSMDLTLELAFCAVQVQTQRVRRLKELYVQKAHEHNAQWALARGVQNWHCSSHATAEENEHC